MHDRESKEEARAREELERPRAQDRPQEMGQTCGQMRPMSVASMLRDKARRLRDEAHRTERLADEFDHLHLSPEAQEFVRGAVFNAYKLPPY